MSAKDGGPAFPTPESHGDDWEGMSLRDYFAAQAMQGMYADHTRDHSTEERARIAYFIADAMLAERDK